MSTGEASPVVGLLTFELDGQRCALISSEVLEVQRVVAMARLPRCPEIVEGVIDLRGKLVPVLDVRSRLGLKPSPLALSDHLVVARVPRADGEPHASGPRVVAIRVDRALDLLRVPREAIEDPRPVAGAVQTAGVAKLADGLVLIHDLRTFLSLDEEHQLDRALADRLPA
jgi:purine-binding chemotaxis protein CheW